PPTMSFLRDCSWDVSCWPMGSSLPSSNNPSPHRRTSSAIGSESGTGSLGLLIRKMLRVSLLSSLRRPNETSVSLSSRGNQLSSSPKKARAQSEPRPHPNVLRTISDQVKHVPQRPNVLS